MSDRIDQAARIIDELEWSRLDDATLGEQAAKALAEEGLLATEREAVE